MFFRCFPQEGNKIETYLGYENLCNSKMSPGCGSELQAER